MKMNQQKLLPYENDRHVVVVVVVVIRVCVTVTLISNDMKWLLCNNIREASTDRAAGSSNDSWFTNDTRLAWLAWQTYRHLQRV